MAIFHASISLVDAYTRKSTRTFQISAADFNAAATAMSDFMTDYGNICDAKITQYAIAYKVDYTDTFEAEANLDEGVTFSVTISGKPNKYAVIKVPAPDKGIFNDDGSVDLTDAGVTAFIANFLSGTVLVSDGEAVGALVSGKLDR